ncbi:MAG: hypothetical protein F6K62_11860 [Sphaerospermopsis sp. SIO1G2]|nr:hypothetical protein [Sphaerospermopsis sp. SIO1G1]NET71592.1 hypothetical protein [Sphaerospermopsis sp. SIO1G2]
MVEYSQLIKFYAGKATDHSGRLLTEIWQQDYTWLEKIHDYIQWLFPLNEKSRFNFDAPILTDEDIQIFRKHLSLRKNLSKSLKLMLGFYGLSCQTSENGAIHIQVNQSFSERKQNWVWFSNHNHLRITRILKSLRLLGLEKYAQALFQCLEEIYNLENGKISFESFSYWQDAIIY